MRKYNTPFWKTKSFILILIILLGLGLLALFQIKGGFSDKPTGTTDDQSLIDLSPPSEEDKEEAERNKQRLAEEEKQSEQTPSTTSSSKQTVVPVIGYLRQGSSKNIEANGYVSETIESDGTCTLTLEKDGQKVSKSKQAMPDAQSTVCGLLVIERSSLSPGDWKATISYTSSKHEGVSAEKTIRIE